MQASHSLPKWWQNAQNDPVRLFFQLCFLWQKKPWERKSLFCLRESMHAQGRRLLIADNFITALAREQLAPCSNRIKAFPSGRADRAPAPNPPPHATWSKCRTGQDHGSQVLQLQVDKWHYSVIIFGMTTEGFRAGWACWCSGLPSLWGGRRGRLVSEQVFFL